MLHIFKNATIYTMNEKNTILEHADLWIKNGKIIKVGVNTDIPEEATVRDLDGLPITPGLIDIHTHVGIWGEINERINDANEYSEPYTPMMSAIDGIDINHFSFDLARKGGVTTVQTGAGSANPIGGVWTILKTGGNYLEEMLVTRKSGLKGALGENPKNTFGQNYHKKPYTRMSIANIIREGFEKASQLTNEEKKEALNNYSELSPFIEVLDHQMPLHLHAHRADDIATAIRIAKEFNIQLSLEHCTEGHFMLEAIKKSGAKVTLGPFMLPATKYETRNLTPAAPKLFHEAGIPFAIMTDHPFIPINYLIICAAEAVKYGLDETAALRSITIEAAKLTGIAHRVGSLEEQKDADFVIWSHHPFHAYANVLETYINGENYYSKETEKSCIQP